MSHNSFNSYDRTLFMDCWECWWCNKNTPDSLHHIVGRGGGDRSSDCESSILNAAPVCNQSCHLPYHGEMCTREHVTKFLNKTYEYLMKIGYTLSNTDIEFMHKYAELYKKLPIDEELTLTPLS